MINVIGAGIAGSLVARVLRKKGHKVRVIDDADPFSGSAASSNLYIASWLKKFSVDSTKGIEVLESLLPASVIDQPFSKGIADAMKVRHVAQRHLLVEPDVQGRVMSIGAQLLRGVGADERVFTFEGPTVVCAGWKVSQLLGGLPGSEYVPDVLVGHCVLLEGRLPPGASSLTMPLPYRHQKLYQFDENTIYFADSTRLKMKSFWGKDNGASRKVALLDKVRTILPVDAYPLKGYRVGYRPIVPGHDFGVLSTVADGLWSINGGGKNGLVAYAKLAAELADKLGPP